MANAKCNAKVSLPEYILERNRSALAAGLTLERQELDHAGRLTTWYRGSEAQWRASGFCLRTKPFNKSAMRGKREFECFSPDTYASFYVQFRGVEGDYRGSVYLERLPKRTQTLRGRAKDILVYDFGDDEYTVYIGQPQALIDSEIAPAEIMHKPDNCDGHEWERSILADGRYCFIDYGKPSAGVDPLQPAKPAVYSDPKAFALQQEQYLRVFAHVIAKGLSGSAEQERHGECTIRYDADTVAKVKDAFDEAIRALEAATPRFVGKSAKQAKQLEVARANPDFQSFLHQLVGNSAGQAGYRTA